MPRYKIVDNVRIELTAEEEAELDAMAETADLDVASLRPQRNSYLDRTDRTQIGDWPLGVHTIEEWQAYRQELRDYMAAQTRISTQTAWPKSPPVATAGTAAYQPAYDAEIAKEGSGVVKATAAGEAARTTAEQAAGYPGPGI